jgi:hypothetical protein
MSRKDYTKIADALRATRPGPDADVAALATWVNVMREIAFAFEAENPRFDYAKFRAACEK